ncbi:MAG: SUMF1/EgtB/PvdO family nonheme iron enzyme [Magnetococcales bacterium]|nr:SUMF1/EgtB/PvdO family nonheme iron enzyme [Magnetococcales bacterium]
MNAKQFTDALPPGSKLLWFEILDVLGKGGFGITYLGRDTNQDQLVAIKEYLPGAFASRTEAREVRPNSPSDAKTFEWGLERFLKEAQTLARFKHPAIVRVVSFFRNSNTAYMVMDYVEGEGLDSILKKRKTLPEPELKEILPSLLDGLEVLHDANYIHRDLKPPNIHIRKDGTPIILDFGSARQSVAGQGDEMTSLLSLGYSPFEQYDSSGERQGPWSDIYAMSGVLYRCITGKKPPDAAMRIASRLRNQEDPMRTAQFMGQGRYSDSFLKAIDDGLQVMETDRPQSVGEWRYGLLGIKKAAIQESPTVIKGRTGLVRTGTDLKKRKKSSWRSFIASVNEFGQEVKNREEVLTAQHQTDKAAPVPIKTMTPPVQTVFPVDPPVSAPPSTPSAASFGQKPVSNQIDSLTSLEFIWVPGGTFQMGSQPSEPGRDADEGPVHEVCLDGFWMSKFPITWEVWRQVMGNYPPDQFQPEKAKHPVESIRWEDIRKFLTRFSNMGSGLHRYRLPTEAEWEYAARSGTQTIFPFKGGGRALEEHAWYKGNSQKCTHPVGEKQPNPWGFHDMLGNVWEWVEDWYGATFYENSPIKNPSRAGDVGKNRIVRGGSWASSAKDCRPTNRQPVSPRMCNNMVGFRIIRLDK